MHAALLCNATHPNAAVQCRACCLRACYRAAFRTMAASMCAITSNVVMMWAPNQASYYPWGYQADPSSPDFAEVDTNHDGVLNSLDDPYGPWWPGDEWVYWCVAGALVRQPVPDPFFSWELACAQRVPTCGHHHGQGAGGPENTHAGSMTTGWGPVDARLHALAWLRHG